MNSGIAPASLEVLAQLPSDRPVGADDLAGSRNRPALLKQMRNLLAHGLVEPASKRPLRIRVGQDRFARALHGVLKDKPFLLPVLSGSHLPLLAALHAAPGSSLAHLAEMTGLHLNTVRKSLQDFMGRALIQKEGRGYAIADHAGELRDLAGYFVDHELQRKIPEADAVLRRGSGLVMIVESKQRVVGLPMTAARRFQEEGADVLTAHYQYRLHALKDEPLVKLKEAYQDAVSIGTSPRTLLAMQQYMDRGQHA